jgi:polysaccharide biosynthesis transport protein
MVAQDKNMKSIKSKASQSRDVGEREREVIEFRESIDLDFSQYLSVLRGHWLLVASVFCLVFFISSLSLFFLKSSYRAQGKILFKAENPQVFNEPGNDSKEIKSLLDTQNPLSTQIEIITSNKLLMKLISRLKINDEKNQPLKPKDLLNNLKVKIIGGTDVLLISYESYNPEEAARVVNSLMQLFIDNEILAKQLDSKETRQFIAQQMPQSEFLLQKADLELLKFKKKNKVLLLPKEIEAAVSEIASLESQSNTIQNDLSESRSRLSVLQSQLGLNPQAAVAIGKLSQSTAIQGQLRELQQLTQKITETQSDLQANHPTLITLKSKQASLKIALQSQVKKDLGLSPQATAELMRKSNLNENAIESLITPDAQQQNYAQLTKDVVTTDLQQKGLTKRLNTLSKKLDSYQLRKQKLTNLEQQQQVLEQKAQAARSTHETLLNKAQQLSVSENENRSNVRIIDPALVPTEPLNSKRLLLLVFATLLGIFSASITPFVLERISRSQSCRREFFKAVKKLERLLPYPLLEIVPHFNRMTVFDYNLNNLPSDTSTFKEDSSYFYLNDHFYTILSKIYSFRPQHNLKSILVTSAVNQEGKSFTASSLAALMAHLGHRVLLIDAHFQSPSQHLIWQVSNHSGLANLLEDKSIHLNESKTLLSPTSLANLDILTSGKLTDNPTPQPCFHQMHAALHSIETNYDYIVIDASPLLSTSDTASLRKIVDGILLVTEPEVLSIEYTNALRVVLEQNEQKVIGFIVNTVISKNKRTELLNNKENKLPETKKNIYISSNLNHKVGRNILAKQSNG